MRENIFTISIFFMCLIFTSSAYSQEIQIENGLIYLNSTQNPTGSWGKADNSLNPLTTNYFASAAVIETLRVLDQSSTLPYQNGLQWLQAQTIDNTAYLTYRISILQNSGIDVTTDLNTVLSYKNIDNGWGGYLKYASSNFHTALDLDALNKINYQDENIISSALFFLTSNQNSDGGFGFYQGDPSTGLGQAESNVYMTALVLQTLSQFKSTYDLKTPIANAAAYLLANQNSDGGFGEPASTVYETALTFESLISSGAVAADKAANIQNALTYLTNTQLPNGSWEDDPYSTALALRALASVKPNLSISSSDIIFSTPTPTTGDTVTFTATIHNTGPAQADNVTVRFYDGKPSEGGIQIGSDQSILSQPPYTSIQIMVTYDTSGKTGRREITVTTDPIGLIDETSETDNTSAGFITINTLPDLSVDGSEITYSPAIPTTDTPLEITFVIRNMGEKGLVNVPVRFFTGAPGAGNNGNTYTIPAIRGMGKATLTVIPASVALGKQTYTLVADADNTISEPIETNNTGSITIDVAGSNGADLSIFATDISFTPPPNAKTGDPLLISALVHNNGSADLQSEAVFYDGDPQAGGTYIGRAFITAPAFGSTTVQMSWTISQSNQIIYVVVDPDNAISETNETNNMAFRSVNPYSSLPDLRIDVSDISYHPSCITPRSKLTIEARVHNQGGSDSYAYLQLFDGTLSKGGFSYKVSPYVPAYGYRDATFTVNYPTVGNHAYHIIADKTNVVQEIFESNNSADLSITVKDACEKDLYIFGEDITFTPPLQTAGQQTTITATIHNTGSENLTAYVSFYSGNPSAGGQLIKRLSFTANQESSKAISTAFVMPSGIPEIFVVVDDDNRIQETDETNNRAAKTIDTYRDDLSVNVRDISIYPVLPSKSDVVTVGVTVHSSGLSDRTATLKLYEGRAEYGLLIGIQDFAVSGSQSVLLSFPSYVYPGDGATLTAVIENVAPAEDDLSNNSALATFGERIEDGATNEGTDFWLAWPPTYYGTADIVIQSKDISEVSVEIPITGGLIKKWTSIVSPGNPALIPIMDSYSRLSSDDISASDSKAIHITSDKEVSVVFHVPANPADADDSYLALPTNLLGTDYYVMHYYPFVVNSLYQYPSNYSIVATEDNTNISAGGNIINLNKGQTYHYNSYFEDLTGTHIRSDKPVAVIASVTCANVPLTEPRTRACDSLMEQMIPVSQFGVDFYTAPLYSPGSGDVFRVLAKEDNTEITIKDRYYIQTIILQAGRWAEFENEYEMHITATKPIMVAQYAKGYDAAREGDPFQTTIIPTDKFRSEYRFYAYSFYEEGNFVSIVIPDPETSVVLDGAKLDNSLWQPLPDKGNYITIAVNEGEHVVSADRPFEAYVHGYRMYGTYGHPAGFSVSVGNLSLDNLTAVPASATEGQLVEIEATLTNEGDKNARDVIVRAFSGDPANGGAQIGTDIYNPLLASKETMAVKIIWDTAGYKGINNIYLVADPLNSIRESNEADNAAMIPVEITTPLKPDLAITTSDITLSKPAAEEGDIILLTTRIRNRGADVGNIPVSLYLGDPLNNGFLLESRTISPIVPLNGAIGLDFQVNTVGLNDHNDLFLVIDPENTISEISEINNTASIQVQVNRKKLLVDVSTDRTQYTSQTDVGINVSIRNEGTLPWTGTGDVYVEDITSRNVSHLATFSVDDLKALAAEGHHYRVPLIFTAQRTMQNAIAFAHVNFSGFASLGLNGKSLDTNSIKVIEFDPLGNFVGEKNTHFYNDQGFDAVQKPSGNLLWLADGTTPTSSLRYFYLYFDTLENGPKPPKTYTSFREKGDLIAFTGYNGEIYTVKRYGDGAFGAPKMVDRILLSLLHGVTFRDFNNDGFPDIISGDITGTIYYYRNRADGTDSFLPKVAIGIIDPGRTATKILQSITSADYNNDGNMDFVLNMSYGNLNLFLGNGDGTFGQSILMNNNVIDIYGKASADFDEDGNMDFVTADTQKNITVYYGDGYGAFGNTAVLGPITNNSMPYGIGAADYDHNGHADVVINEYNYKKAYLIRGMAEGLFNAVEEIPLPPAGRTAYDLVDVNGDGVTDLLAAQEYPSMLLYFEGSGDGTFGQPANLQSGAYYTTAVSASRNNPEITASIGTPEKLEGRPFNFTWNTGSTPAGNYKVHVMLSEGQTIVAEDYSSFDILPDATITSKVVTDKISYSPNQSATLTSSITSQSTNYIFDNLTAKTTIANSQGAILFTETNAIPILTQGQLAELKTYWNTSTYQAGSYPVTLEVRDSAGALLSISVTTLTISGEIRPSKLLKGQISVDKQTILQGEPLNITYGITNIGNMDLASVDLAVLTVSAVTQNVYDTLTDQTALPMGSTYTNAEPLNTQNYTAKDYLVVLKASISGVEETLAGAYFRVEGAPSEPSLNAPQHGADVETFTPALTVNNAADPNDDQLTYDFELYADSGLTDPTASGQIQEGNGMTSWQVPVSLTENAWYFWRARACDGILYGAWMEPAAFRVNTVNDPPTAPTLSSPADGKYVDTLSPVLTVNNAFDPDSTSLIYNFRVAADPNLTNIIASQVGVSEGQGSTSWQVPTTLRENTWYYWTAQADDWLTTGPWMPNARFFINITNEAPSAPVITAPADDSEVATTDLLITASNSADPDSSELTYIFEMDTAETFDSADKLTSGTLPQGDNSTSWPVSGLKDNTWYYVRAKASDGKAESVWSTATRFFVNTQNDAPTVPVLSNPSDGSGVNVFAPALEVHNSTDIDGDILTYEFEVYGDALLSNLISSAANIQETPQITGWAVTATPLTENSIYYWRARAFDGELYSGWTLPAWFMVNTANDAPSAPTVSAPAQGGSVDTLTPVLSINNSEDPDSDMLTYDFEIYTGTSLVMALNNISEGPSGVTSVTPGSALSDNTTYTWRARTFDGDRYGAWMDTATFSVHMPVNNIVASLKIEPETLNRKSKGKWLSAEIELPKGYRAKDVQISSILLEGTVHAEKWPYHIGCGDDDDDHDRDDHRSCDKEKDNHCDGRLKVKFKRSEVLKILPNGKKVKVHVIGVVGTTAFEGVDTIRVIH